MGGKGGERWGKEMHMKWRGKIYRSMVYMRRNFLSLREILIVFAGVVMGLCFMGIVFFMVDESEPESPSSEREWVQDVDARLLRAQFSSSRKGVMVDTVCISESVIGRILSTLQRLTVEVGAADVVYQQSRRPWNIEEEAGAVLSVLAERRGTCLFVPAIARAAGMDEARLRAFAAVMEDLGEDVAGVLFGGDERYVGGWCLSAERLWDALRDATVQIRGLVSTGKSCEVDVEENTVLKEGGVVHTPGCLPGAPWRCVHVIPMLTEEAMAVEPMRVVPHWYEVSGWLFGVHHPERPFFVVAHIPKTGGSTMKRQQKLIFPPSFTSCNGAYHVPFALSPRRLWDCLHRVRDSGLPLCDTVSFELIWDESLEPLGEQVTRLKWFDLKSWWYAWLRLLTVTSQRSVLTLTMLRDPVGRVISWSGHHGASHNKRTVRASLLSESIIKASHAGTLRSMSDPGVANASMIGSEHARLGFWTGATEFYDLSICLLTLQLRHPNAKDFCTCKHPSTSTSHTSPATKPVSASEAAINALNVNKGTLQDRISVGDIKRIEAMTRKHRIIYAHVLQAIWQRAEAFRSAIPDLDIECLAFPHQDAK